MTLTRRRFFTLASAACLAPVAGRANIYRWHGTALGAKPETLMGLAGLGDLVLTCTGDLSRNRRLGIALGRGVPLKQAIADIGQVVESIVTVDEVVRLARRVGIELPIAEHVQHVLHEDMSPEEGLRALLAREQKPEYPE